MLTKIYYFIYIVKNTHNNKIIFTKYQENDPNQSTKGARALRRGEHSVSVVFKALL